METVVCRHCNVPHINFKCACTHDHNDHTFGGGCKIKGCLCDRYDASKGIPKVKIEKAPKAARIPKISPVIGFAMADIDLDKLTGQTETTVELMLAQGRVDKLRKQKEQLEAEQVLADLEEETI